MNEQDGTQSSTKQRRSRKTSIANQQHSKQVPAAQRPHNDDKKAWNTYWKAQGQPWRTEPEIDAERQKHLTERRSITPDIEKGIYLFKDMRLSRADVEWLLATLENGRGAVDWNDENQREREGLDLRGANLRQENLSGLPLARMRGGLTYGVVWFYATDEQRNMAAVQLQEADLTGAQLQKAHLTEAQLQEADLNGAQLQGADLREAQLDSVRLNNVILSDETHGTVRLADTQWGEVNLAVIDWGHVTRLGDEQVAQQEKKSWGKIKDRQTRVNEYKEAVRANRQLAVVLRDQGLNEEADHFAYRAQLLQRKVWGLQRRPLKSILSWFLYLLAGYGYRPLRSLIAYLIIIFGFTGLYLLNAHFVTPHLRWNEALVLSVSSFHGRGFFSQDISLGDTYARLAAGEAVIGLLIEVSLIATFTQRFFAK
jgi:hypothetical protein